MLKKSPFAGRRTGSSYTWQHRGLALQHGHGLAVAKSAPEQAAASPGSTEKRRSSTGTAFHKKCARTGRSQTWQHGGVALQHRHGLAVLHAEAAAAVVAEAGAVNGQERVVVVRGPARDPGQAPPAAGLVLVQRRDLPAMSQQGALTVLLHNNTRCLNHLVTLHRLLGSANAHEQHVHAAGGVNFRGGGVAPAQNATTASSLDNAAALCRLACPKQGRPSSTLAPCCTGVQLPPITAEFAALVVQSCPNTVVRGSAAQDVAAGTARQHLKPSSSGMATAIHPWPGEVAGVNTS